MAVGTNASGDYVKRATSWPPLIGNTDAVTIAGWIKYRDTSTIRWAYTLGLEDADTNSSGWGLIGIDGTGGVGGRHHIATDNGGFDITSPEPSQDTWVYVVIQAANQGDGTVDWSGGYFTAGATAWTDQYTAGNLSGITEWTPARLNILNDSYDEWIDACAAYVRVWTATLTEAELLLERDSYSAVKTTDLWADWPLADNTDTADISGNGRSLTFGGSITTETSPGVTRIVAQTGGDYSSLSSALADAEPGDTISIQGTWSAADTTVCTLADGDVTITADADSAHNGREESSPTYYRLITATNGSHAITVSAGGTVIENIYIKQNSSGASDECIRVINGGTNTFRNLLLTSGANADDQDGIYTYYSYTPTINIEQCIFWGFSRRGIGHDQWAAQTGSGATFNINSCTIWGVGTGSTGWVAGIGMWTGVGTGSHVTLQVNIHNTVVLDTDGTAVQEYDIAQTDGSTRSNLSEISIDVSYSIDSDGSIGATGVTSTTGNLNSRTETDSTSPGTGDWVILQDITSAPYDLRLVDNAENDAQDMHSTATAEGLTIPSTDIVGTSRPQNTDYDCGAFEIVGDSIPYLTRPQRKVQHLLVR